MILGRTPGVHHSDPFSKGNLLEIYWYLSLLLGSASLEQIQAVCPDIMLAVLT
jgi:hypothetical protein